MSNDYPRKVKAKVTRTVTQMVICNLNKDGTIDEVLDIHDEIEIHDETVDNIVEVLNYH
jgi:hypothetical protein